MFHPLRGVGYGNRVSEGVALVNADALQGAGVTGRGVKVGILDFGFQRYGALVGAGELPRAKAIRAFNRAGRVEANSPHGTGCAEIIADMAPKAELYVAAVDGADGQIIAAAQWLAGQGVDIINFSGGGHFGLHNGTALLDRFVDHTVREHDDKRTRTACIWSRQWRSGPSQQLCGIPRGQGHGARSGAVILPFANAGRRLHV